MIWRVSSLSTAVVLVTLLLNGSCKDPVIEEDEAVLSVSTSGEGVVQIDPRQNSYVLGTKVSLLAIPAANWKFSQWTGDISDLSPDINITMNENKTIEAQFTPLENFTLTIDTVGRGSITLEPDLPTYIEGTEVTITAVPTQGYAFEAWSGVEASDTSVIVLTMDANKSISATFKRGVFPEYGYSADPTSSLVFKTFSDEGDVVFYGTKNPDGTVQSIDLVTVQTIDYEEPVMIELDVQGRPTKVHGPLGEAIEFAWVSEDEIRVKATSRDGNQVTFPYSPNEDEGNSGRIRPGTTFRKRTGEMKAEVHPLKSARFTSGRKQATSNLTVRVDQCSMPYNDGQVYLHAKGVDVKSYDALYKATSNGDGTYSFDIQIPEASNINADKICLSVEEKLGYLCTALTPILIVSGADKPMQTTMCVYIASYFAAASLPVFVGCEVLMKSMAIYCLTAGASAVEGAPSPLAGVCEWMKDNAVPTELAFNPSIHTPGGITYISPETSPFFAKGPFPELSLTLPDKFEISSFFTTPVDPEPGQDYVATGTVVCATEGTTATITITGSDGFTDSSTVTLPAGNSEVTLFVPGADGGVQDILSIEVQGLSALNNIIVF